MISSYSGKLSQLDMHILDILCHFSGPITWEGVRAPVPLKSRDVGREGSSGCCNVIALQSSNFDRLAKRARGVRGRGEEEVSGPITACQTA